MSEDISDGMGVLAAEYALGLLTAEMRADVEARMKAEPSLVADVQRWQVYFATVAEVEVEDVPPPARLQAAVEAELFGQPEPVLGLLDRVAFWRGISLATTALAVLAVGFAILPVVQRPDPGGVSEVELPVEGIPAGTLLMTHLIPTEGSTLGLAVTREPSGTLQVRRVAGPAPDGRAQELWVIVGEAAPVSLGVLEAAALTTITPPADVSALFGAGAALAVSDEPAGGSPTGTPTGDILALGSLVAL